MDDCFGLIEDLKDVINFATKCKYGYCALASEESLAKDWELTEEDKAWESLNNDPLHEYTEEELEVTRKWTWTDENGEVK